MNAIICCGENEGKTKAQITLGVCAQRQIREERAVKGGQNLSEKCESKKVRGRKDTLLSGGMGEKDMGGRIGGSHLRPLVDWWHRNRDAIHQLTLT